MTNIHARMLHSFFKITLLLTLMMAKGLSAQNIQQIRLDTGWQFQSAVELTPRPEDLGQNIKGDWYNTTLPNTVLNALFENKVIDDPFYRNNESRLQWLEKSDWIFEKRFDATPDMLKANHAELILRGLDTYGDVYINDALVIKADNMFRTWRADIQNFLKPTGNVLKIYFSSPIVKEKTASYNSYTDLPAIPENTRVFTRKAGFHYGWDWGPRFVTCGLQSAEIQLWNEFRMVDVCLKQTQLTPQNASIQAQITIEAQKETTVSVNVKFGDSTVNKKADVSIGLNRINVEINIPFPKFWWIHNWGTPYLYDVKVKATTEGGDHDEKNMKHGLRTIELVQHKDSIGESFFFKLNGIPIFAKGANMIPINFFQERVKQQDINKTIDAAIGANMNMLRVWGGGIYQPDEFYKTCDEKGILIWQDFMYACAMYPGDDSFLENARLEAVEQVKRLRNYSCLALWCGNNEINEAWNNWGWQPRFNPDQKAYIWKAYQDLFQKTLPQVVKENANETGYYESSPRYSRYNNKSYTEGDSHDWFVWHDEKPFEHFEEKIPRFASEYGFQSFPEWKTLQSVTEPKDLQLESEIMLVHQKHPRGNSLMKKYMDKSYRTPKTFEDFVYVSQLVQAEGIRRAIEAQRRSMPLCMGSLYWQLNDVWQAASWSSLDNLGRWKALHYSARDAYANTIVSPVTTKDSLYVYVVNDMREAVEGELFVQVGDFSGRTYYMDGRYVKIKANSVDMVYQNHLRKILQDRNLKSTFVSISFRPANQPIINRLVFFAPPKELLLEKNIKIIKEITAIKDGYNITLQSPSLLKNVYLTLGIEGTFSNNFFDIIPNQTYNVILKTKASLSDVSYYLKAKSLVDTY